MAIVARGRHTTGGGGSQVKGQALRGLALCGVVGLSSFAAACGGGSSGAKVAQVGSTTSTGSSGDPVAYAACMRKNGVRWFPDPDAQGGIQLEGTRVHQDSVYRAAVKACKRLLPNGPTPSTQQLASARSVLQKVRQYAACIRQHGYPSFPDPVPNAQGGLDEERTQTLLNRVNSDSPRLKAAHKACERLGSAAKGAVAGVGAATPP